MKSLQLAALIVLANFCRFSFSFMGDSRDLRIINEHFYLHESCLNSNSISTSESNILHNFRNSDSRSSPLKCVSCLTEFNWLPLLDFDTGPLEINSFELMRKLETRQYIKQCYKFVNSIFSHYNRARLGANDNTMSRLYSTLLRKKATWKTIEIVETKRNHFKVIYDLEKNIKNLKSCGSILDKSEINVVDEMIETYTYAALLHFIGTAIAFALNALTMVIFIKYARVSGRIDLMDDSNKGNTGALPKLRPKSLKDMDREQADDIIDIDFDAVNAVYGDDSTASTSIRNNQSSSDGGNRVMRKLETAKIHLAPMSGDF